MTTTTLTAETGSYSVFGGVASGTATNPTVGAMSAGSFTVTGSASTYALSYQGDVGSFSVTGSNGSSTLSLVPSAGSYAVVMYQLALPSGAYTVTGNAAHFTRDFVNWYTMPSTTSTWTPDNIQTIPPPVIS